MSNKSAIALGLIIFASAIGLAYALQVNLRGEIYSERTPASDEEIHLKSVKSEILKQKDGHAHKHTQKLKGPLELTLIGPKNEIQTGDVFDLSMTLSSYEGLSEVDVLWSLPSGVRLVAGRMNEKVQLSANEPLQVSITLQWLSEQNEQIHAHASSELGPMGFSEVAQFNTVLDRVPTENKQQALEKSEDESSLLNLLKVFE